MAPPFQHVEIKRGTYGMGAFALKHIKEDAIVGGESLITSLNIPYICSRIFRIEYVAEILAIKAAEQET